MSTCEPALSAPGTSRTSAQDLRACLHRYRDHLTAAAAQYDGSVSGGEDLDRLVANYSRLVTDPRHEAPFAQLLREGGMRELIDDLREQSARCAAVMEKYRALRLLEGRRGSTGYFTEVESCIEEEFGSLSPTADSTLLLIGSGSFPMTLLTAARRTGATAVGIDIDAEAVRLGRTVLEALGSGLDITLSNLPAEDLDVTAEATHIVLSSTVPVKYELMDRLHGCTREDVVVAMRFGDGLKSLFNYPMQEVDPERWRLLRTVRESGRLFDIALYSKPGSQERTASDG